MKYISKKYFKDNTEYLFQITYKDEEVEYFYSTYKELQKDIDRVRKQDNVQSVALLVEDNQFN